MPAAKPFRILIPGNEKRSRGRVFADHTRTPLHARATRAEKFTQTEEMHYPGHTAAMFPCYDEEETGGECGG